MNAKVSTMTATNRERKGVAGMSRAWRKSMKRLVSVRYGKNFEVYHTFSKDRRVGATLSLSNRKTNIKSQSPFDNEYRGEYPQ